MHSFLCGVELTSVAGKEVYCPSPHPHLSGVQGYRKGGGWQIGVGGTGCQGGGVL